MSLQTFSPCLAGKLKSFHSIICYANRGQAKLSNTLHQIQGVRQFCLPSVCGCTISGGQTGCSSPLCIGVSQNCSNCTRQSWTCRWHAGVTALQVAAAVPCFLAHKLHLDLAGSIVLIKASSPLKFPRPRAGPLGTSPHGYPVSTLASLS